MSPKSKVFVDPNGKLIQGSLSMTFQGVDIYGAGEKFIFAIRGKGYRVDTLEHAMTEIRRL